MSQKAQLGEFLQLKHHIFGKWDHSNLSCEKVQFERSSRHIYVQICWKYGTSSETRIIVIGSTFSFWLPIEVPNWQPRDQGGALIFQGRYHNHHNHNISTKMNSYMYTPRTLRACCSLSEFRILKIRESRARALFLYNCTWNTLRAWA